MSSSLLSPLQLAWLVALLLAASPASAQLRVQKVYGTTGNETGGYLIPARAGGYLLVGVQQPLPSSPANQKLYLVRTNAQGDTLWTRTHKFPRITGINLQGVCENSTGQTLIATSGGDINTGTLDVAMLILLNSQGDTIWTRKTGGPTYNYYTSLLLGNDGNFVLTGSLNTFPQWLKVNAAGQVVARTFINYDANNIGYVTSLFKDNSGLGGYWLVNNNGSASMNERKFLHLTESGTVDQTKPLFGTGADYIYDIAPIANQDGYMVCERGRISRFSPSLDTVWTQQLIYTNRVVTGYVAPTRVQPLADGNFVLAGGFYYAGGDRVYLAKIAPSGQTLRDTVLFRAGGEETVRGLAVEPGTSNYVFSGWASQGPIGGSDLFLGIHAHWRALNTRPGRAPVAAFQAWPNPISSAHPELTLRADRPLAGLLTLSDLLGRPVRTWPAARTLAEPAGQRLPLAGLPPGLYLLTGTGHDGRRYAARILCE